MTELRLRSKVKRMKIINSFEEVSIKPGTVIEYENSFIKYFWVILDGEVEIFKRTSCYDKDGKYSD